MTDATPHRATVEQWESLENDDSTFAYEACILELRTRVEALEVDANEDSASTHFCFDSIFKRLEALEAGATCPHVVTSDEGTSYCGLAEQQARIGQSDVPTNTSAFELSDDDPIPHKPAPAGSLVEAVAIACAKPCNETWDDQARAAIREVAEWLRGHHADGDPVAATALEREARR